MTGADIVAVATSEIGYHEKTGKINKYGEWYRMNGVPWCMQFVQWCYAQAGCMLQHKTASCGDMLSWYKQNDPFCISKFPVEGCIVIFDFPKTKYSTDHTGIFVSKTKTKITTIDGNTSNGNESNGGYVQKRTRSFSYANPTYIIPRELVIVDWDRAISEMTDEQAYKLYCKAENYMLKLPLPTNWNAQEQLDKAVMSGITDGSRPQIPARRYEVAIMCERFGSKK